MDHVLLKTLLLALIPVLSVDARPWTDDVIYFVMTDRFFDGDPANNIPAGSDPELYDPSQKDIGRYMGGDLRGMEKAVQAGYFSDLGITALWLTPVVKNVWRSGGEAGGWKSGYHGYWTQDWLDIDPHLASRTSLSGQAYSDDAEGRMEHYRDFVKLAHSKGIKVIQDVVLNHAGPVFYYDANGNGMFDTRSKDEWIQPFRKSGFHDNAKWIDIPRWNALKAQPDGPRELLGTRIPLKGTLSRIESYGRKGFSTDSLGKSDGEEVECDFFSLRDLWTAKGSAGFDELVDEFVEIYHFYLTTVGVDGLRIDTVKHVHQEFWDAFTERLRKRLGSAAAEKILFGEVYDGNPAKLGQYTWRTDWKHDPAPGLDSVLDFNFCFNAREYLRHPGDGFGSPSSLEKSLQTRGGKGRTGRLNYNPAPGPDGLNSRQKLVTFIENHDGLNRFRVAGVTAERNRLAQALVMALPGIPCLYYGTEWDLADEEGRIGQDGETGRLMFFGKNGSPTLKEVKASASFTGISRMAGLRAKMPLLRTGSILPLWVDSPSGDSDDGVFAYGLVSADGTDFAIVVVNASPSNRVTSDGSNKMLLPGFLRTPGKVLRPVFSTASITPSDISIPAEGPLGLPAAPSSLVIYAAFPAGK